MTNKEEKKTETVLENAIQEKNLPAETDTGENQDNYIIYTNNIYSYVDDFIMSQYPDKSNEELKENKAFFPALVLYLYNNCIGDLLKNKTSYRLQKIKPDYKDINFIDNLFNIYIDLVYKYKWNNKPFMVEFSILTGINKDTFYNWVNGIDNIYKGQDISDILTRERSDIVKTWFNFCESALLNGNDTIKDIFVLKAKYGYRDNNNDINITVNHKALISADQLPDLIGITEK